MQRTSVLILVTVLTVLGTDLFFESSLRDLIWPAVLSPAASSMVEPPVLVRWRGARRARIILIDGGLRQDLGIHDSPLELDAEKFPRSGQYGIELQASPLGAWSHIERYFLVRVPTPSPQPLAPPPPQQQSREPEEDVEAVLLERDRLAAANASLKRGQEALRRRIDVLSTRLDDSEDARALANEHGADLEEREAELRRLNERLAREAQALQSRLNSIPPCTAWGYLAHPRPHRLPSNLRVVIASDQHGQVFRTRYACEVLRRGDRAAASPCACVGQTWGQ